MNSMVVSAGILGIEAYPVEVQVDTSKGLERFEIVGLPETSIKEGRTRIVSAIRNSGFSFRGTRVSVNLSPSSIRKEGVFYDLPIALGILASKGFLRQKTNGRVMVAGELSLDGQVRSIRGALLLACKCREMGLESLILPKGNLEEVRGIGGVSVYGVENLYETVQFINGEVQISPAAYGTDETSEEVVHGLDFSDVKGQESVKRGILVAVSGGHNIMMMGPPGSGKTMLARRIPTILPSMSFEERIETAKIMSVAGMLKYKSPFNAGRPFRAPHHTISDAGMVGGNRLPRPGEMSLANNGVLFLDEFSEFKKNVLEVMRQPLEDGVILISRALGSIEFPARVMLVAAMNPCPCGNLGDRERECECPEHVLKRFYRKISNPLLDRIDIHVEVPRVDFSNLTAKRRGLSSGEMRNTVSIARSVQMERLKGTSVKSNSQMTERMIEEFCPLGKEGVSLIETAMLKLKLSARAYSKILKVSRTIADMDGSERIMASHVAEAIHYRSAHRRLEFI